jgi:hypothetical protein
MPCAVGLDDLNAIFIAGGSTNGTRLSGLSLNLKKVKYEKIKVNFWIGPNLPFHRG